MTLKQTLRRLMLIDIWSFTVYNFAKKGDIKSNDYDVSFLSQKRDAYVTVKPSSISISLKSKYDLSTLNLIRDLKRKFPTSNIKIVISD